MKTFLFVWTIIVMVAVNVVCYYCNNLWLILLLFVYLIWYGFTLHGAQSECDQ
jgi:hypothetical protein